MREGACVPARFPVPAAQHREEGRHKRGSCINAGIAKGARAISKREPSYNLVGKRFRLCFGSRLQLSQPRDRVFRVFTYATR